MHKLLLLQVILLLPGLSFGQEGLVHGRVIDSVNHEPLPFVNIVYNDEGQGVVSDQEGYFSIPDNGRTTVLRFRYLGYGTKSIAVPQLDHDSVILVMLSPIAYDIDEVVIYPSENPANRIIKLAAENRQQNNPERAGPFSYNSYEKMVFTLVPDSASSGGPDAAQEGNESLPDSFRYGRNLEYSINAQRLVEKQHLFLMEQVSSRKFLSRDKDKEEIIASRVSGVSQPTFAILARQFQSFSFYDNFITIAGRQYVNPISSGSTDRYFFLLQDTLFTEAHDTVFIISFRPMPDKNFEGMEGVLYIHSKGYAVQNVMASGRNLGNQPFEVSIQQRYDLVDGERWFPVSLNTRIILRDMPLPGQPGTVTLAGIGTADISRIDLHPDLEGETFSDVQIRVNPDAARQPEVLWNAYRTDSLDARELETYRVIDSIGEAEHLDRTLASLETLLTGYIPGRYVHLDIRKFIDYNRYEGFRFGLGGRTSDQVSQVFSLDGYFAYGIRDKGWKYGGGITVNLHRGHELRFNLGYFHDVTESGGISYHEVWSLSSSAFIRNYMVQVMDITDEAKVSLGFRAFRYLTGNLYLARSWLQPAGDYAFSIQDWNPSVSLTLFDYTEAGLQLRYAYDETFMQTPRGNKFSMGTNYPIIYFNFARGMNWLGGGYIYYRSEIKVTKSFQTKSLGETRMAIEAGMVSTDIPYSKLYAAPGSYRKFTFESEASFGTMRLNEFLSDRFISLFIKHDFGNLLFRPRGRFQPEVALVHNMGFGTLRHKDNHDHIIINTLEKGYFEGGLLINNLLRLQILRYGLGVFYRYGPYGFSKTIDNFAFKLTLQLNL